MDTSPAMLGRRISNTTEVTVVCSTPKFAAKMKGEKTGPMFALNSERPIVAQRILGQKVAKTPRQAAREAAGKKQEGWVFCFGAPRAGVATAQWRTARDSWNGVKQDGSKILFRWKGR